MSNCSIFNCLWPLMKATSLTSNNTLSRLMFGIQIFLFSVKHRGLVTQMFLTLAPWKDCMYCAPVVIKPNFCGKMAVLAKTIQLTPQPPTPPTGCAAFTSTRDETSTCSHTGHNHRQLHARLPSQPHPCKQKGSLSLSLTIRLLGIQLGMSSRAYVWCNWVRSHVRYVKLNRHHVRPKQNVPAVLLTGEPIRLEEGKAVGYRMSWFT